MSKELTRRQFLRTAAQGAGIGILAHFLSPRLSEAITESREWSFDPTWRIYFKEKTLNYDSSSQLARRFNNLWEALKPDAVTLPANEESVRFWIDEIAPMFQANGIYDKVRLNKDVLFPKFLVGDDHTGLLGSSDCQSYTKFNYRFANPLSSWANNPLLAAVVAHEFNHIQQGDACNVGFYGDDSIEVHSQVAAYEVLASLANEGNRIAYTSLVYMLRREFFRSAWGLADKEGRTSEFDNLCEDIHDPRERALVAQDRRDYESHKANPKNIFNTYSIKPLREIIDAYFKGEGYPQTNVLGVSDYYYSPQPGKTFVFKGFKLDDLFYFSKFAEEMR